MSEMVWVNDQVALNMALITRVEIAPGAVRLLDVRGACTHLEGDDAARFLSWFDKRAALNRND